MPEVPDGSGELWLASKCCEGPALPYPVAEVKREPQLKA